MFQKTIKDKVSFEGIGIHCGEKSKVILHPWEKGIAFLVDKNIYSLYEAKFEAYPGFTSIFVNGKKFYTLEHLFSALHGLEIDNVLIEIVGKEVPALDGSALEFVKEIEKIGFENLKKEKRVLKIRENIKMSDDSNSYISVQPAEKLEIFYHFEPKRKLPKLIDVKHFRYVHSPENFKKAIAPCRTFCFREDIEKIKSLGLGKGGSLENTLIIDIDSTLNPPRNFYEPIGHKILDLLGDLYTLGYFLKGKIEAKNTYHILNINFVKSLKKVLEEDNV